MTGPPSCSAGAPAERAPARPLHVRWLGLVPYRDAHALQTGLHTHGADDHLLLLEHPHVYTLGIRGDLGNLLRPPAEVGADLVRTDRGGDVTYHGPGQLVGYPILTVPGRRGGGLADTGAYVCSVEQLVIDSLADLGLTDTGRLPGFPGVWVAPASDHPRKICAVGVKLTRGRSMHGFALNVHPDMAMFGHIVPCGLTGKAVTSLAAEGTEATMREVVDVVAARAIERWGASGADRADVVWRHRPSDLSAFSRGEGPGAPVRVGATTERRSARLAEAGVTEGLEISSRKPTWMRAQLKLTPAVTDVRRTMRDLDLVTVCEEAGCPNLSECWADGTATFMINGERCTRACGFCLVDTQRPVPTDPTEPARVAEAVERMGLRFAVVTAVARDDLADGGAAEFAAVIRGVRQRTPHVSVEVLIPDCKGDPDALRTIFDARPDVLNHNLETVARLQRAVRPSAGYARSLAVLARGKAAGLTTKSSLVVGMGETTEEVVEALADLRGVGADIVTIGQYLRPTTNHLPVARWWTPEELTELKRLGEAMGIGHVEAGPLVRASYHARQAADSVAAPTRGEVPTWA
ncbi:MAG: lipoyl synthase [Acidimicrobiales bacterium]|nr:lipoyl synthase [Acidimicrobiales bacterium]